MELIDYVRMLGRRWRCWVSLLLLGTLAGVLYVNSTTTLYSATSEVFVASSPTGPASNTTAAIADARSTVLDSMPSYASLIDAASVLEGVLEDVPTSLTQNQLADRLKAVPLPRTVVLRVTATSSEPRVAAQLSTAAAKRLGTAIENLETPAPGVVSPVKVVITRPAKAPVSPTSPNRVLAISLGLLVGLGLGLIAASLRDQAVRSAPDAHAARRGRRELAPAGPAFAPQAPTGDTALGKP
jgi:capsular polysaccharide biosynthesis protein